MNPKGVEKVVRLRYMQDFACLGDKCEDTCCAWWTIQIDQSHYTRLKRTMDKDPVDKAAFAGAFKLAAPDVRTRDHFALMVLKDDGDCRFLDDKKLCGLHSKLGEELLPDACATYPRAFSLAGPRLELTGEPSCPEVARRLLLREDAVELDDAELGANARVVPIQQMPTVVTDAYWGVIDRVRGTLYRILHRQDYSTSTRLFFAMFFAAELDKFLRPNVPGYTDEKLEREIEFIDRDDVRSELQMRFAAVPEPTPLPISLIAQMLATRAKEGVAAPFFRLIAGVLGTYNGRGMRIDADDGAFILSPEALHETYRGLVKEREPLVRDALDLYFRNYLCHQVLHDWYTFWPNLFVYMQNIALRVATLRFLILSHPRFDEAVGDRATFDALVVEVFYLFSRALEHSKRLLDEASLRLQQSMPTLPESFELLKV